MRALPRRPDRHYKADVGGGPEHWRRENPRSKRWRSEREQNRLAKRNYFTGKSVRTGDKSSPAWERLSEALTRVIAAGLSGAEARMLICEAIAKREVRFRWRGFTDDQVLSRLPAETATLYRNGLRQDPVRWARSPGAIVSTPINGRDVRSWFADRA